MTHVEWNERTFLTLLNWTGTFAVETLKKRYWVSNMVLRFSLSHNEPDLGRLSWDCMGM
jgi:hypothetical protein